MPQEGKQQHCVLCHQALDEDAQNRFSKFQNFITGKLAEEAQEAKNLFEKILSEFQNAKLLAAEDDNIRLEQLVSRSKELSDAVKTWVKSAEIQMQKVLAIITNQEETKLAVLSKSPSETIAALIITLQTEKADLESSFDAKKRQGLLLEKAELEAYKILYEEKDNIKRRRDLLLDISKFDQAINLTATKTITQKANELVDTHLTKLVSDKFAEERKGLNIDHLNIKLKRESDRTGASFKTTTEASIKCQASDILSEGEQRALALSAFLTETHVVSPNGPIIIDDPVSSLDRERSAKVAKRLAQESQKRQVIVFTHDIIFYNEICEAAQHLNIDPANISIFTNMNGSGYMDPAGEPWKGKPVDKRINVIKNDFQSIKKLHQTSPSQYEKEIKNIYGRLRDAYERTVEEKIFNNVIVRYGDKVQTTRLRYIDFSDELAEMFYQGMTKASTYSHDNSSAGNVHVPDPKEIEDDIQHLKDFLIELDKSYVACEKRRAHMT